MDVDNFTFPNVLASLLKYLSTSHFVSFDLELSGIPRNRQGNFDGQQTIQQRYDRVKEAAETYHILQFGLTCVEQDQSRGFYLLRTFNFNLSPLVQESLGIDRTFSYSSSAVDFLLSQGYQMESPFTRGVPYLTWEEAIDARQRIAQKLDKNAIPDIIIKPDNTEALEFVERARQFLKDALEKDQIPAFLRGKPAHGQSGRYDPLTRFEKRLTHQLVRNEFPELQSYSRADCMAIQWQDDLEQNTIRVETNNRIDFALFTQTGFRLVTEAIAGNDLSLCEPRFCGLEIKSEPKVQTISVFEERMKTFIAGLFGRPRVLVGHNCFMDLVFIWNTFYGALPDTIEEFAGQVNSKFPLLIDTKYMSTAGADASFFKIAQLSQMEEHLAKQKQPVFEEVHETKVADLKIDPDAPARFHEAGYDSLVTAKVFLKLSSKLRAEATASGLLPSEGLDQVFTKLAITTTPNEENSSTTPLATNEDDSPTSPETSSTSSNVEQTKPSKSKLRKAVKSTAKTVSQGMSKTKTASTNIFDILRSDGSMPSADSKRSQSANTGESKKASKSVPSAIKTAAESSNATESEPHTSDPKQAHKNELIPAWSSEFWRLYGNKLRVYGTKELMVELKPAPAESQSASALAETVLGGMERVDSEDSGSGSCGVNLTDEQTSSATLPVLNAPKTWTGPWSWLSKG